MSNEALRNYLEKVTGFSYYKRDNSGDPIGVRTLPLAEGGEVKAALLLYGCYVKGGTLFTPNEEVVGRINGDGYLTVYQLFEEGRQ